MTLDKYTNWERMEEKKRERKLNAGKNNDQEIETQTR